MVGDLITLGLLPSIGDAAKWIAMELLERGAPYAKELWADSAGTIGRLGDVFIWQSAGGRKVIATLESVSESQTHIEQVVGHIETAQIGLGNGLSTLTSLSMIGFGTVSFASVFMLWRMNALHRRLDEIGQQISDIQAKLTAEEQAHLLTSLEFLSKYERSKFPSDLHTALEASTLAKNLYRGLIYSEANGSRRLVVLNQCGRYYLLALTAQIRCLILQEELLQAEQCMANERPILKALAKTVFDEVLGKSPERFLDPALKVDNVTLRVLTELYQQAHLVGAIEGTALQNADQTFEYLRERIYGAGAGWFAPIGNAKTTLVTKLKYLIACLEEVGHIESLRLRVALSIEGRLSFAELEKTVASAKELGEKTTAAQDVMVFGVT